MTPTPATNRKQRLRLAFDIIVTFGLFGVALWIRAGELSPSSIWLDDAWVAVGVRVPWGDVRAVGLTSPGFVALLRIVTAVVGRSSFGFQFTALMAGALLAPAIYLGVIRRFSRAAALAGALLVLWAPINVTYSTRVKQYTLDSLIALLLILIVLRLLDDPRDRRRWSLFLTSSIAAIVVSSVLAIVVGAGCLTVSVAIVLSTDRKQQIVDSARYFGILGAFAAAYYAFVLRFALSEELTDYWAASYLPIDQGRGVAIRAVGSQTTLLLEQMFAVRPVILLLALLGASSVVVAITRPLAAVLFLSPVLITMLFAALKLAPYGGGRVDCHLLPGLVLMIAFALGTVLDAIDRHEKPHRLVIAGLVVVSLFGYWVMTNRRAQGVYPIEDIRPLVEVINEQGTADETVLVYYASVWPFALYTDAAVSVTPHDEDLDLPLYDVGFDDPNIKLLARRREAPEQYRQWIEDVSADRRPVWFVSSHPYLNELEIIADMFLDNDYELESSHDAAAARLEHWVPQERQ